MFVLCTDLKKYPLCMSRADKLNVSSMCECFKAVVCESCLCGCRRNVVFPENIQPVSVSAFQMELLQKTTTKPPKNHPRVCTLSVFSGLSLNFLSQRVFMKQKLLCSRWEFLCRLKIKRSVLWKDPAEVMRREKCTWEYESVSAYV